jgi:Leucine-rich repeat (LRR) protein
MINICNIKYDKNITSLYLTKKNLTSIPDEVYMLDNLEILCLSHNFIQEISPNILRLKKLKMLYLNYNILSEIPLEIFNIKSLEILILSNNNIINIPDDITKLVNLKELWLYHNKIFNLPIVLSNLTKITGLYLNSNNISTIPSEYGQLTNLESLILDCNNIITIPYELIHCNLKYLYLNYNPIQNTNNPILKMIHDKMHTRFNPNKTILNKTISIIDYTTQNGTNIDEIGCNICFTSYTDKNIQLLILGCHNTHIICSECIELLKKKTCPYCNVQINMTTSLIRSNY